MKKYFIIFIVCISFINADELSSLIAQIKNAPNSQKRVLINKLKEKLRSSNTHTRKNVVASLRGHKGHLHLRKRVHLQQNHTQNNLNLQQKQHNKRITHE